MTLLSFTLNLGRNIFGEPVSASISYRGSSIESEGFLSRSLNTHLDTSGYMAIARGQRGDF